MVPKHDKEGEEIGEQAEGMESGASYAIAQKRGPSVRFLSTAGSTPLFVVVPKHDKEGEEIGEQAESMESGASYAIAQKRGPSYARSKLHICPKIGFRVPYGGGGPSCQRKKSEAAQPENLGRGRGETVGGHGT